MSRNEINSPVLVDAAVGRVTTLSVDTSVEVRSTISVNLVLAVGLVVILALTALEARIHLSTSTDAVANLGQRHLVADTDNLADNLVTDGQRVGAFTPVAADGVTVAGADAAALDLDVDVVVAKGTGLEGVLFKVGPSLGAGGLEALELFRERHGDRVVVLWGYHEDNGSQEMTMQQRREQEGRTTRAQWQQLGYSL